MTEIITTMHRAAVIARGRHVVRELYCPICGGDVDLEFGRLVCVCGWAGERLAELAVRP